MEFNNNFLDYQSSDYQGDDIHYVLNQWPGTAYPESYAAAPVHATPSDDIEDIYVGLHKCVDQVVQKISVHAPPRLDQIREQNRKLIDKLTNLECTITTDVTGVTFGTETSASPGSTGSPPTPVSGSVPVRGGCKKRRRVSRSTAETASTSNIPNDISRDQNGHENPLFDGLESDSPLAKKLLQIGTQEARTQLAEFAAQLKAPEYQSSLPNIYQFSNVSQITDVSHFLRLVLDLGLAIESSSFGEQTSRIRKRIALAHFYHAYTLAQSNPDVFLSWCDDRGVQGGSMLPKGGNKSVVQHRFADLIFSRALSHSGMPSPHSLDHSDDAKRRTAKIQMWRKGGKKWAQIIHRFGYGILLLLPSSLSDEDLRLAHDNVVTCVLNLIDSRKHLFADVLQEANNILDAHFFPQNRNAHLTDMYSPSRLESANWDDLLDAPTQEG
ncbi:hypothetical protein F5Y04DRAFT_286582 [Hypomontagnella monticulosa]|nr:hypothetical protein F5Y04DRAFT_286582 [Hypomontagnella monticulosa]